jgi:hypothetical protein
VPGRDVATVAVDIVIRLIQRVAGDLIAMEIGAAAEAKPAEPAFQEFS